MGEIDWGLQIWTTITFIGLFLVLARFVFGPLQKLLQKREDSIRESLEKAEEAKLSAEKILAENEKKLSAVRDETRKMLEDGHKMVAKMRRQAEEKTKSEADQMVIQAKSEIDRELQKGLEELKSTVAGLSVRISRQVLKEELNKKRHEQLVDDFIERLKKSHAAKRR
ncbi:F0F1 ATP synthase subunit B [Verrucomicrobiota bacterium]